MLFDYDIYQENNADYYTFGSGHWVGLGTLDSDIYHQGDLIGVVYDNPNLDITDVDF